MAATYPRPPRDHAELPTTEGPRRAKKQSPLPWAGQGHGPHPKKPKPKETQGLMRRSAHRCQGEQVICHGIQADVRAHAAR
jgi:hypothetical protein